MVQTLKQLQRGELKGATSVKLAEGLFSFPEEIFELADTLEVLDLSQNKLNTLPAGFGRLKKLRILFCSGNLFTVLPEVLGDCPLLDIVGFKANIIKTIPEKSLNTNLRWLILTDNLIKKLPSEIGHCQRMQKLMLAGNQLESLPQELSRCRNLSLLRISANRLTELPDWLLTMPKLSWLGFSGNKFSRIPVGRSIPSINWKEVEIRSIIGEGASGVIYKARLGQEGQKKDAAIKIFKGSVTSDGLPEDELNACIVAGSHPGLIPLIGQVEDHPEHKKGLIMQLIPQHFYNLGLPPSFESCTRDIFTPGTSLTAIQILRIAQIIASAATQLHSKGIMHSDLYAHNILIDKNGNALLGDFGAACFYDRTNNKQASALELMEVSAYGCLLEDLLNICNESEKNKAIIKIAQLKDLCMAPDVLSRPFFADLDHDLGAL